MKFNITPNGNLEIVMEDENREDIQDLVEKYPHDGMFLRELLVEYTGWTGNGQLYQVNPEDVAALTDAPIVTDELEILDNGDRVVHGSVWWFPAYERYHFGEELLKHGRVFFTFAPPVPESAHTKELATA
jgi:hypothetical protein